MLFFLFCYFYFQLSVYIILRVRTVAIKMYAVGAESMLAMFFFTRVFKEKKKNHH